MSFYLAPGESPGGNSANSPNTCRPRKIVACTVQSAFSSNSWGYVTDASYYGKYSVYAAEFDSLIASSGLLVVKAAGNSGAGYCRDE